MKTIHCKHYSPRHAHSTHQSPHSARQMQTRHSTCLPPALYTHSARQMQTRHSTCLPPHSTHSRITHTEKKCKMAQGSKQVWESRPKLKRNVPRLRKSRSRSKKSDPRSKKRDPRSEKRGKVKKKWSKVKKKTCPIYDIDDMIYRWSLLLSHL